MGVLVTGAAGQLGRDLLAALDAAGIDGTGRDRSALDVADRDAVRAAVDGIRPAVVVNCAAWTAVDACEGDPQRAMDVNGRAVEHLAQACRSAGSRLVQISTDYVFDGTKTGPYVETDTTNPLGAYGRSKLAGEQAALGLGDDGLVVRTSWVFSRHGGNMAATIARLVDAGSPLRFVDDQVGCPTFTPDLAEAVVGLVRAGAHGIVHVTNQVPTSWYEFARQVVARLGADPDIVTPIRTAELQPPRPATRPANSVLDNRALSRWGRPLLRDHRAALDELFGPAQT